MKYAVITSLASLVLIGCTHTGTVSSVTAANIYSGYDTKIYGGSTFTVDTNSLTKLKKDDSVKGLQCGAHRFPVDAGEAFTSSIPGMLDAVFYDATQSVADPRKNLPNFVFRVERFDPTLKFNRKFFGADAESTVELTVSVVGTLNGKRVFGTTVDSQRTKSADGGMFCEGGSEAVTDATSAVIKDVLEKIGERISNSQQIRAQIADPALVKKK